MKPALTRRQRTFLLVASAVGYVASSGVVVDALQAQGSDGDANASWTVARVARSIPVERAIRRDPFAGKPALPQEPARSRLVVPDIGSLPPEAAFETPSRPTLFELKATIAGPRPVAYVKNGDALEIVREGSRIGDRTVAHIGLHGITFADGTSLELTPHTALRFAPATAAGNALDQIRRLVRDALRGKALGAPAAATDPPSPALPAAAATGSPHPPLATAPPPGPLPTIVPDFLPVGLSPTSDPNGATPYPLPPLRPPY